MLLHLLIELQNNTLPAVHCDICHFPRLPKFAPQLLIFFFFFLFPCLLRITTTEAFLMTRQLPERLLIGYANHCDGKVIAAIEQGVNVVIWSFLELQQKDDPDQGVEGARTSYHRHGPSASANPSRLVPVTSLDLGKVRDMIRRLDERGLDQTVHLVSFGGWNGPHLHTDGITPEIWYRQWKQHVGDIFHGIDWDLEGHDDLQSQTNVFSIECLEFIGRISQLAKYDGYIVGIAPPQSYLDIHNPRFSRGVNLTKPERPWHSEFHYFGANVYSYILSKYGEAIDFVSIQFYESYSSAAMHIYHHQQSASDYLCSYVGDLVGNDHSFQVNFADDPTLNYSSRPVILPLSKLVWGFANGWAMHSQQKTLYVEPEQLQTAYTTLVNAGTAPRGFMYWVIVEEGTNDVHYTKALAKILQSKTESKEEL